MARGRAKGEWRKPGRRQGYRVLAPERHLIVCEGEKTEPLYFQGMRDALKPEFRNRIHIVVKGTGLHTVDLLDYALRESRLSGGYDHVWLAYDRDDFDLREFDSVVDKCAQSDGIPPPVVEPVRRGLDASALWLYDCRNDVGRSSLKSRCHVST